MCAVATKTDVEIHCEKQFQSHISVSSPFTFCRTCHKHKKKKTTKKFKKSFCLKSWINVFHKPTIHCFSIKRKNLKKHTISLPKQKWLHSTYKHSCRVSSRQLLLLTGIVPSPSRWKRVSSALSPLWGEYLASVRPAWYSNFCRFSWVCSKWRWRHNWKNKICHFFSCTRSYMPLKGLYTAAKAADYNYLILWHNKGAHQCLYSVHVYIFFFLINMKMYCHHWPACVDLLIISELINDVALAFTTGTGDLADATASKPGSLLPLTLSWSHRSTLWVSKQCRYIT